LQWNVSDYNGVRTLRLSSEAVWRPDTLIINKSVALPVFMSYNFISPSQHGSITVIKKKKIINTTKQQYWKKEKK